jgi:hypothetical protein
LFDADVSASHLWAEKSWILPIPDRSYTLPIYMCEERCDFNKTRGLGIDFNYLFFQCRMKYNLFHKLFFFFLKKFISLFHKLRISNGRTFKNHQNNRKNFLSFTTTTKKKKKKKERKKERKKRKPISGVK